MHIEFTLFNYEGKENTDTHKCTNVKHKHTQNLIQLKLVSVKSKIYFNGIFHKMEIIAQEVQMLTQFGKNNHYIVVFLLLP